MEYFTRYASNFLNRLSRLITDGIIPKFKKKLEEISCTTSSLSQSAQPQSSVASAGDGSDEVFFDINAKRLDTVDNRLALQDSEHSQHGRYGQFSDNIFADNIFYNTNYNICFLIRTECRLSEIFVFSLVLRAFFQIKFF